MKKLYLLIGMTMCCAATLVQANNHDSRISELFSAIEVGDETQVNQLIVDGVSPDAELDGVSALMKAIELYKTPLVRLLLRLGADPNKIAGNQMTPFTYALSRDLEYYSILGTRGGDINAVDGFGKRGLDYIFEHHERREAENRQQKQLAIQKLIEEFEEGLIEKQPEEEWVILEKD